MQKSECSVSPKKRFGTLLDEGEQPITIFCKSDQCREGISRRKEFILHSAL